MIKLKDILLEDRLDAMKDKLKLSDNDVLYLKSLNVPEKYIIWLANQYKLSIKEHGSNKRFKEDAYKYEDALQKFYELSNKNKITDKNINNYKDIFALYDAIEKFDDTKSKREIEKDIKIKGAEKVYEDSKWLVVIPKTEEAACYYGKGTMWCTAATKAKNWFNDYNERGDIYTFINKLDNDERYQLHVEESQFKDITDSEYDINRFKKNNPELTHIFDIAIKNGTKNFIKNLKSNIYADDIINGTFNIPDFIEPTSEIIQLMNIAYTNAGNIFINQLRYNEQTKNYDSDHNIYISENLSNVLVKDGELTIQFGHVKGYFHCAELGLTSLKGCPKIVDGSFNCSSNDLNTLEGCPEIVNGNFSCDNNNLKTLKGCPKKVGGNFHCDNNDLNTLKGSPAIIHGYFSCSNNYKLSQLKDGPQIVHGDYWCNDCNLDIMSFTEFRGKVYGNLFCHGNNKLNSLDLKTIRDSWHVGEHIRIDYGF